MNRIRLLLIWLICMVASGFATIRMLYAIAVNPQRAWVLAIAYDQLANAAANGDPDETISSRAHRARLEGRNWGCLLCRFLDWVQQKHCEESAGV